MKKNKIIALCAGLSLAFVSTAALAAPSADTLLVAGYDSDQMSVLYGVSAIDQDGDVATLDCTLDGDFAYVLDTEAGEDDSEVAVSDLTTVDPADGTVEFPYEDGTGSAVAYADADECALTSVKIEPNGSGKINHGKVVSTFAHLLKGGNGCLIRHFAQSDFGKGDYDEVDAESFEVTLQSFETACTKNKDKKVDDDSAPVDDDDGSSGGGKANAPGQNKDKGNKGNKGNKGKGQAKKANG